MPDIHETLRAHAPVRLKRLARRAREEAVERTANRALARVLGCGQNDIDGYSRELFQSGLLDHLDEARMRFSATVSGTTSRGDPYTFGQLSMRSAPRLYAVVRAIRPAAAVETGVCNGLSTAVLLQAMNANGVGRLYSIDLPEISGADSAGDFWSGKKGAVVPRGKEPGWVVPDVLRSRWELIIGRTQEMLPQVLERVGQIQFFLHDSEHSYECMTFEYQTAYPHLEGGGVLASDDVGKNTAFAEFADETARRVVRLGDGVALIRK